jgi:hypothetical protein
MRGPMVKPKRVGVMLVLVVMLFIASAAFATAEMPVPGIPTTSPALPAAEPSSGLLLLFGVSFLGLALLGRRLWIGNDSTEEADI